MIFHFISFGTFTNYTLFYQSMTSAGFFFFLVLLLLHICLQPLIACIIFVLYTIRSRSSSRSRSRSPANEGQVKFITSFGAESDEEGATVQGPSLPPAAAAAKSESSTSLTDSKSDSNRHHSWSVFSYLPLFLQHTCSALLLDFVQFHPGLKHLLLISESALLNERLNKKK